MSSCKELIGKLGQELIKLSLFHSDYNMSLHKQEDHSDKFPATSIAGQAIRDKESNEDALTSAIALLEQIKKEC